MTPNTNCTCAPSDVSVKSTCEWSPTTEEWFDSECGKGFIFNDGGATDNGFVYCPFCGLRIVQLEIPSEP